MKKLYMLGMLILLIPIVSASTYMPGVHRNFWIGESFTATTIAPNQEMKVILGVNLPVDKEVTYYAIDEIVPDGWTIIERANDISEIPQHLMWYSLNATNTSYIYKVKAPSTPGIYAFEGIYMFEGDTEENTIKGHSQIEVFDCNEADTNCNGCLEIDELLNQIERWKNMEISMMDLILSIKLWHQGCYMLEPCEFSSDWDSDITGQWLDRYGNPGQPLKIETEQYNAQFVVQVRQCYQEESEICFEAEGYSMIYYGEGLFIVPITPITNRWCYQLPTMRDNEIYQKPLKIVPLENPSDILVYYNGMDFIKILVE